MARRVVISASRRTDIPAFHARWLLRRLDLGFCEVAPPFGGGSPKRVSLRPEDVAAIVFWTRNPRPLIPRLDELAGRGYRFTFLFTIVGYPREIDARVPPIEHQIASFRTIAERFGPDAIAWRYDPIVLTTLTPPEWHVRQAATIARRLEHMARRCHVSFVSLYRKTLRNMGTAAARGGFAFDDPPVEARHALLERMVPEIASRGFQVLSCAQDDIAGAACGAVARGRCIDRDVLARIAPGAGLTQLELRSTRPMCGCHASVDIGAYDSCLHACAYCYAVSDHTRAIERFARADRTGALLGAPRP